MFRHDFYHALIHVSLDMAPFLLFGFLLAGVLSVMLPTSWVRRHLSGRGLGPVVKASLFGIPLPLCSCGVIPVSATLRERGASRAATVSFLVSTPQTGVDSILVTASLLGWVFAIYRTLFAFVSGVLAGAVAALFGSDPHPSNDDDAPDSCCEKMPPPEKPPCCCSHAKEEKPIASAPPKTSNCCGGTTDDASDEENGAPKNAIDAIGRMLHFGFVQLPKELAGALILGLVVSALVTALLPDDFFGGAFGGTLHGGLLAMVVMMAAGIPVYVCATASVPLAWALLDRGATPGMALVFLMTGPATNAATISALWRIIGRRTTLIYLATIALTAIGGGLLLDGLYASIRISAEPAASEMLPLWIQIASAATLYFFLAMGLTLRYLPKPTTAEESECRRSDD